MLDPQNARYFRLEVTLHRCLYESQLKKTKS